MLPESSALLLQGVSTLGLLRSGEGGRDASLLSFTFKPVILADQRQEGPGLDSKIKRKTGSFNMISGHYRTLQDPWHLAPFLQESSVMVTGLLERSLCRLFS